MNEDLDVLVVGAGPTGLFLGSELLRRGLRVRVVDKAEAPTIYSKAVGVHARTLEILDDLGVADDLVSRGIPVEGTTMIAGDKPVMTIDFGGLETRFPFLLCVSQVETESVLNALLERRGGKVERKKELVSFSEEGDGIVAVLRSDGAEERVRASYVVGCDGAHSAVRHAVGATFEGHTYEEVFVLADVHIDWEAPGRRLSTYFHEEGVAACFPMKDGRWRVIITAAESLGDHPTLDEVRAVVERRVGKPMPMRDAVWIAPFRINCRQVERYRYGRAFLAGDAAHIHSPIGGQGMNTGIQDAHNLAWKLGLAARGRARPELLDSYDAERHPIGKHVLRQTDLATKLGTLTGALVPIRNHLARIVTSFDFIREQIIRDASELTVGYEKSPIVGERRSSTLAARFGRPEASESPTVGSRLAFAGGPKPGTRMLDGAVRSEAGPTRLARLLDTRAFTLLLFDGRSASARGYESLTAIERSVRQRWGDRVATLLVTPRSERPREIPDDVRVVFDDAGELERLYGASTECLYLVRPDLYIGFRAQPASESALVTHLASILG